MSEFLNRLYSRIPPDVLTGGLKVLGIIFVAYLFNKFSGLFIEKLVRKAIVSDRFRSKEEETKRENTVISITNHTVGILVWLLAVLIILSELGVDIGPLLAAAGVVGIAFGFGGQYLIRDVIAGLFTIFENQYRVGDVVCFGENCGLVEDITLRKTTLRNLDGVVIHVPHGEIQSVHNLSKDFARVNLDIGVAYDSKLEKVIEVVNRVGSELADDPAWQDKIIKPPQFLRVNDFADSAVMIKILGDTKPLEQWAVTGELRKRIKIAFDKEGIEIPFPQRVVHKPKG